MREHCERAQKVLEHPNSIFRSFVDSIHMFDGEEARETGRQRGRHTGTQVEAGTGRQRQTEASRSTKRQAKAGREAGSGRQGQAEEGRGRQSRPTKSNEPLVWFMKWSRHSSQLPCACA